MDYGQEFRKFAVKGQGLNGLTVDQYMGTDITSFTPMIIEERPMNIASMDVFSRLMKDRIIFLGVPIGDEVANIVVAQLLFMQSTDPSKDVIMYINSPGGSVYAGLAIYDTMQIVSPDISTVCTGMAASMGSLLLTAGQAGKRSGLPHSRVMIHQPSGAAGGQASDIQISAKQIVKMRTELYEIYAQHTGQTVEQIKADSDRDNWMSSAEAKEYGLIDEVLGRAKKQ
jgi:ATP-dependent Clp protease, protease subunit